MGAYQAWLDALPPSLADSATAEALRAIRGGKWEATIVRNILKRAASGRAGGQNG
jgi:hypothetical protein